MNISPEAQALKRFIRLARSGRLAELRENAGLRQTDVAEAIGVDASRVSRWETSMGRERPRPRHAVALLEVLDAD
jgi:transcriptional regulator with XRE-family HTH domain